MPRREYDEDEAMVTCPQCRGKGQVYDIRAEDHVVCPLCAGQGSVRQAVSDRFRPS